MVSENTYSGFAEGLSRETLRRREVSFSLPLIPDHDHRPGQMSQAVLI